MSTFGSASATRDPIRIIQPCSEGCTCYRPLPGAGWSEFGVCANRQSPYQGYPVRLGHECPIYQIEPQPPGPPREA